MILERLLLRKWHGVSIGKWKKIWRPSNLRMEKQDILIVWVLNMVDVPLPIFNRISLGSSLRQKFLLYLPRYLVSFLANHTRHLPHQNHPGYLEA